MSCPEPAANPRSLELVENLDPAHWQAPAVEDGRPIVAARGEMYIAHILGATDGSNNWYAIPARFVRCHTPQG